MSMTRKDFLKLSLGLGAAAAFVSGCGSDDKGGAGTGGAGSGGAGAGGAGSSGGGGAGAGGAGAGGAGAGGAGAGGAGAGGAGAGGAGAGGMMGACANGAGAMIDSNHGHVLMVSAADVAAGVDKTYDITGTATHGHMVTLTATHFMQLKNGGLILVTSTNGGTHTHPIEIRCSR